MIKLTEEQLIRLDSNIGEAMEDLRTAVFGDADEASFLSVGANVGMALQKLQDVRQFLADEEKKHAIANKSCHMNLRRASADPWTGDETPESVDMYLRGIFTKPDRDSV
jgi:hypothetical protein